MTTHEIDKQLRELAHRRADGMDIRLLWNTTDDRISVEVHDHRYDQTFEVPVPSGHALDAFHHPFAYTGRLAA
jgi:hypothetical protein